MSVDRKFQGYCSRCHELREVTSGSFCPVCTSPLMDLHEVVGAEAMAGTAARGASQIGDSSDARALDAHSLPPQTPAGWSAPSSPPPAATPGTQGRQPPRRRVLIALFAILAFVIAAVAVGLVLTRDNGSEESPSPTASPTANAPVVNAPATNPTVTSASATVPAQSSSAESIPIAPAETVTVPPATGGTGDVVIVGSNAFAEDSTLTIGGEGRTLYTVAELRNDGPQTVQVGAITVTIRDAAGTEIGRREDYPIDRVLDPGETTYLYEFTPSMMYWETETNTFPEGWAAFDLAYEVESPYGATEFDDVNLATEQVQVERSGTDVLATGLIRNSTDVAVSSYAELYVALYDAEGRLINVAWTYATPGPVEVLQPGETLPFEVNVWAGPTDYASAVVGAVATPSL